MLRDRRSASRASCSPTGGRCRTATASRCRGAEHAAADRAAGGQGRARYGAALAIQLLDAAEPGDSGVAARPRSSSPRRRGSSSRSTGSTPTRLSGFGLKTAVHDATTRNAASIQKNDQTDPAIGMSHIALAEQAAEESMVLLKNDNNTLPIKRPTVHKIAVIGANGELHVQSDEQPGHAPAQRRASAARSTSRPTSAPATSARAACSPTRPRAPARYAGIMAAAAQRRHGDSTTAPPPPRRPPASSSS